MNLFSSFSNAINSDIPQLSVDGVSTNSNSYEWGNLCRLLRTGYKVYVGKNVLSGNYFGIDDISPKKLFYTDQEIKSFLDSKNFNIRDKNGVHICQNTKKDDKNFNVIVGNIFLIDNAINLNDNINNPEQHLVMRDYFSYISKTNSSNIGVSNVINLLNKEKDNRFLQLGDLNNVINELYNNISRYPSYTQEAEIASDMASKFIQKYLPTILYQNDLLVNVNHALYSLINKIKDDGKDENTEVVKFANSFIDSIKKRTNISLPKITSKSIKNQGYINQNLLYFKRPESKRVSDFNEQLIMNRLDSQNPYLVILKNYKNNPDQLRNLIYTMQLSDPDVKFLQHSAGDNKVVKIFGQDVSFDNIDQANAAMQYLDHIISMNKYLMIDKVKLYKSNDNIDQDILMIEYISKYALSDDKDKIKSLYDNLNHNNKAIIDSITRNGVIDDKIEMNPSIKSNLSRYLPAINLKINEEKVIRDRKEAEEKAIQGQKAVQEKKEAEKKEADEKQIKETNYDDSVQIIKDLTDSLDKKIEKVVLLHARRNENAMKFLDDSGDIAGDIDLALKSIELTLHDAQKNEDVLMRRNFDMVKKNIETIQGLRQVKSDNGLKERVSQCLKKIDELEKIKNSSNYEDSLNDIKIIRSRLHTIDGKESKNVIESLESMLRHIDNINKNKIPKDIAYIATSARHISSTIEDLRKRGLNGDLSKRLDVISNNIEVIKDNIQKNQEDIKSDINKRISIQELSIKSLENDDLSKEIKQRSEERERREKEKEGYKELFNKINRYKSDKYIPIKGYDNTVVSMEKYDSTNDIKLKIAELLNIIAKNKSNDNKIASYSPFSVYHNNKDIKFASKNVYDMIQKTNQFDIVGINCDKNGIISVDIEKARKAYQIPETELGVREMRTNVKERHAYL